MRILNIAAFAVSGYACTDGRHCKPFNPLLGETYEADYPDKGLRFFSEKVFFFFLPFQEKQLKKDAKSASYFWHSKLYFFMHIVDEIL